MIKIVDQILYQDDLLVAVNKPPGLLTIRDGFDPQNTYLASELEKNLGKLLIVHRLDRDTSGVILFARTADSHRALNQQFQERQVTKVYHLLAFGSSTWESIEVDLPLRTNVGHRRRTVIDSERGKPARTCFNIKQRLTSKFFLIEATPLTGYTHQIRAHICASGYWILNDALYTPEVITETRSKPKRMLLRELKDEIKEIPINRLALHASRIVFTHPSSGQPIGFEAPYPDDFRLAVQALGHLKPTT